MDGFALSRLLSAMTTFAPPLTKNVLLLISIDYRPWLTFDSVAPATAAHRTPFSTSSFIASALDFGN
jgi:hypothetical protein